MIKCWKANWEHMKEIKGREQKEGGKEYYQTK